MLKKILLYVGSFLAAVILLWSALILTSLVPKEAIKDNLLSSALSLNGADPYYQPAGRNAVTDNYADVILLNVVWNMDSENPFASSLDTKYYDGNDGVTDYGENYGLYAALNGAEPNTDYTRYWHGSAVFIRPLLTITDLSGIRLTGAVFALLLLAVNCALLIKRKHYAQTAALILSLVCVQAWNIRLSMEYQPAVLVTLAVLPLFILLEKKGDRALIILSVISGVLIAFFDFLTAETLTILVPLIIVLSIRFSEGRFMGAKAELLRSVKCSAGWLLAYCGTFLVKWTAASLAAGENKFTAALTSAEERFGGSFSEISPIEQIFAAPFANISAMFGANERGELFNGFLGAVLLIAAAVLVLYLGRNKKAARGYIITVFILGSLPYLRYAVLSNHSYLHDFFTYRAQAAAVLALITGAIAGLQKEKEKGKDKEKKGRKGQKERKSGRQTEVEFTILMPCLNEEKTIGDCIEEARRGAEKLNLSYEILIADNGSTDSSADIARKMGARVVTAKERGYGSALICGINAARGKYIIMGDCDLSYDFENIGGFVQELRGGAALVVGNRFKGNIEKGAMPLHHRYFGIPLLSFLGRLRYGVKVGDFHCGIRGFRRENALSLGLGCSGMEFATELIGRFAAAGFTVREIPADLRKDGRNGKSHLRSIRDGFRHLAFMMGRL